MIKRGFSIIAILLAIVVLNFSCQSGGDKKADNIDKSKPGIIEAEKFVNQEKGAVEIISGRVDASKDIIVSWNNAGHKLEWKFYIATDGDYQVVFRYCHNRGGATYRQLLIDGKSPGKSFDKIKLDATGGWSKSANDWRNLVIKDESGNVALVNLKAGVHLLSITNLGGDGQDGAANFDSIAFLPKDADVEKILGKATK